MPGIAHRFNNTTSSDHYDTNVTHQNPSTGNGTLPFRSLSVSSISCNGFWSQPDLNYNQLQKFWFELKPKARRNLLRIDKQTLFEHARKNMYCSRCNGLLLEGFLQIVMYAKPLQQDSAGDTCSARATDSQNDKDLCISNCCQDDTQDPSVHPWGGLTAARDGTLTLLDCYLYSESLEGIQNVFDSARARERERELLYPDACGGGGRGWISQGIVGYGRGHGTRETCALHTARLSVETLVDFWSALGEETRQSLLRMKEEDFIERLMYRFDSKRFCRDCRRNVIHEFKMLKELKRGKKGTRCTIWFCVADTAFNCEVSCDTVQAEWHQAFPDASEIYHHFEWAIGTSEGNFDIFEFEDVGMSGRVEVNGLDLSGLNACYITVRAWRLDGRCDELFVKAHALRGQQCVHCRLVVGDGYVTIIGGESMRRFFEHAEEAEEEEDDDSVDKDGNELYGECSRPQKHAKSPELAREFLLDAATVIFKEQIEKAFREGTARQNAHSIFVCLALNLLEERVHVACKEIITLEKQTKLLEEEEKEKREEEERKERRRTKEREKKLRRKERLREKESREKKGDKFNDPVVTDILEEATRSPVVEVANNAHSGESLYGRCEDTPLSPLSPDIQDNQLSTEYMYSNAENPSEDIQDDEFINMRDCNISLPNDHFKYSRRKLKFSQDSERDLNSKWSNRSTVSSLSEYGAVVSKYESRYHADGFEPTRSFSGFNKHLRTNVARTNNRNSSKTNEKFQCHNDRTGDKFASHSCNCDHHEFRSRPDSHMVRVARDSKYVNNLVSPSDISKPCYRGKKYAQVQCAREIIGRPKSKIVNSNPLNAKKVWEPTDSQKKHVRSNSDSDVTLRFTSKVKDSESDQIPECCSTISDEVRSFSIQTNTDNPSADITKSKSDRDKFHIMAKPQDYLKEAVAEDKCPSWLSEGESNIYSNSQNLESTSTSDSEESSQYSEGRETSHGNCLVDGIAAPHTAVKEHISAGMEPLDSCLKEATETAAPSCESGRENLSVGSQPQCVLPQVHNQRLNYPIFQAPTMGYYHQNPLSWPATNGLISLPHSNHFLFPNTLGYGYNANAQLMQLQHVVPPLHNHTRAPVFPAVSQFNRANTKESPKVVSHNTQKVALQDQQPTEAVDAGGNGKPELGNNSFSLFHFGGPVAYTTGSQGDEAAPKEGSPRDTSANSSANALDGDGSCNEKGSVEEYNLFATTNGLQFSIF